MTWLYALGGLLLYLLGSRRQEISSLKKTKKGEESTSKKTNEAKNEVDSEDIDTVRQRARDKWLRK